MSANPYTELYKTLSAPELLDVLDNAARCEPQAVEAAAQELGARKLSDEEYNAARQLLTERKNNRERLQRGMSMIEDKVRATGAQLGDNLQGIYTEAPGVDRMIKVISLFLVFMFVWGLTGEWRTLKFVLSGEAVGWDIEQMLEFASLLWLPVGAWLFWKRRRAGWNMAFLYFVLQLSFAVWVLIEIITYKPTGMKVLDKLLSGGRYFESCIIGILLYTGLLSLLLRKQIRLAFNIGWGKVKEWEEDEEDGLED